MQLQTSKARRKSSYFTYSFSGIGTQWEIELWNIQKGQADKLLRMIQDRVADFEAAYSRFRDDSLVGRMSRSVGIYKLSGDAKDMLDMYQRLYKISHGKVTPLIGRALSDAGYDAKYSLIPKKIHHPPQWEECLHYDFPDLKVIKPVLLDFGGLGKGALVDIVSSLLKQNGAEEYVVNAGGDIFCKGHKPVKIGLRHPSDDRLAIGVARISHGALCGSAGTYRRWDRFTHIIDPHDLDSPNRFKAVWVHASTTLVADALTTALYFVDPNELHKHFDFEYAIIHTDDSIEYSAGFPADFFNGSNE